VDAVDAAVASSVTRQLVSDVPVGAFLSGGVDSPLIAAHMQAVSSSAVQAFTIGTDDRATDESEPASMFAEILHLRHQLRRISGADAIDLVGDVAAANTEPFGDYSSFPTLLVSQLASEHVKVVLSGDGGDELFWGYPRFGKVREARRWFHLPRAARIAAYGASKPLAGDRRPARGIMFRSLGDWYLDAHSRLHDTDLRLIAPGRDELPADFTAFDLPEVPSDRGLLQWMRSNELRYHLPMVLQKVDRASMYHSLEVRVPLLDPELVGLAARLDPSTCVEDGIGKRVLRTSLGRRVPPERIPLPKRGFTVPMARWLRQDLRPAVQSYLFEQDPFPHGYFDRRGLAEVWDDHREGRRDVAGGLWNLLSLQLWAEEHLRPLAVRLPPAGDGIRRGHR
jgi:asparagine synthase (glutamine-hydrolysing)